MLHKKECVDLEKKLIEKILTDPEARRIAEEFIRNQFLEAGTKPSCPLETLQQ